MSLLPVLAATLAAGAPAGAPAADHPPAGRALFTNCFWTGPRGRDFTGGAHAANNFPDASATYWFARFALPEGARLELRGRFPHARYMALSSYVGKEPLGSLHDAEIRPDRGSANPFRAGARRNGRRRAYTVSIVATDPPPPGERRPNTFYAGDTPQVALAYRVYVPDRGRDVAGDTGLPRLTLVAADGSRHRGRAACAAINTPDHDLQTTPPLTLDQWSGLIHTPGLDPAVAPATPHPFFQRFFNGSYNFLGDFRPETRTTLTPPDNGGAFSNADTRYLYATINRRFGPLVAVRGTLPTVPRTRGGEARMGHGQLRYWSVCTNETPVSGRAVDCAYDELVPLGAHRRYTILIGRAGDRPANATRRCGVRWLRWGAQRSSPEDPGYGLVLVRNMLAAPGFKHAAQRVTTFGTERRVMGRYLPRARYTTPRSFAAHGCPR
jgi:hypothetical protein